MVDAIDASDKAFGDLRLAARSRIAAAIGQLKSTGRLNRADIMRLGEVSMPQASADIRLIQERLPGLMTYDKRSKTYRLEANHG